MDITPFEPVRDLIRDFDQAVGFVEGVTDLYNQAKRIRFTSGNTASRFHQRIGIGPEGTTQDNPASHIEFDEEGMPAPVYRRKGVLTDPSVGFRQYVRTKRRYGRKISSRVRHAKLLNTVSVPQRYRFGSVQDADAANGTYWLNQQWASGVAGTATYRMPVYMFNLFTTNQGPDPGFPDVASGIYYGSSMFELYRSDLGGYYWGYVTGKSPSDGATATAIKRRIAPTVADDRVIGRKGLLDWTRIRLCIWGKKANPATVRVRLVRFTDEEFTPEHWLDKTSRFSTAATPKVNEFWENYCKYLVNGHQGGQPKVDNHRYMKVLKEFVVNINPIDAAAEATGSDTRAHMRHLDIFNRWNRVIDYTESTNKATVPVIDDLRNQNLRDPPTLGYTGYLRKPEQAVYVIIDSVQPLTSESGGANAAIPRPTPISQNTPLTASFDFAYEGQWSVLDKL